MLARPQLQVSGLLDASGVRDLLVTVLGRPSSETLAQQQQTALDQLTQCLRQRFRTLAEQSHARGRFSGRLTPPLHFPDSIRINLAEGGRSTVGVGLNPDYGKELTLRASSDASDMSAVASRRGPEMRVYVASSRGGGSFDATLTLHTNLPALPVVHIPVHAAYRQDHLGELEQWLSHQAPRAEPKEAGLRVVSASGVR